MKKRDAWRQGAGTLSLLVGAVLLASSGAAPARAADDMSCRGALAGAYLATIVDAKGGFASRSIVTIHGDGTLAIVDSRQNQGVQGSSFSAQQGSYRCTSATAARARTLDFSFPKQEGIARLDWSIALAKGTGAKMPGAIGGTVTLVIYAGVKGVDPFGHGGTRAGVFRFNAVRIAAPGR